MVYRGKPSTACAECRKLRSRCDKKLPACGQCIKAGRLCSGYRSTVDLMFLDESTRVVSQNRSRISPHHTELVTQKAKPRPKAPQTKHPMADSPLKLTGFIMYQPLDDLGVKFFMTNFIVDDPAMSLLHYLPDFYIKTGCSSPALSQICAAVGLVGLVNKSNNRDMLSVATHNYGAAIRAINTALLCPKKAAEDCIVASVYLAAMFEALMIPRQPGMDNAGTHLAGAISVAHLILKQQRQTDITIKLCTTLWKTVMMNCWIQDVPLPPDFIEFKRLVEKKAERVSVYDSFLNIVMNLVQFKQEYQYTAVANPTAIIERALAIDTNLDEYARDLALEDPFETSQLLNDDDSPLPHKGYFQLYPQHLHAHLWNHVRTTHIRLHQAIIRQRDASPSSTDSSTQRKKSKEFILPQIMELLASVPRLAGYKQDIPGAPSSPSSEDATTQTQPDSSLFAHEVRDGSSTGRMVPQYSTHSLSQILYQLYMDGSEPRLPQPTEAWIQQRKAWERSGDNYGPQIPDEMKAKRGI